MNTAPNRLTMSLAIAVTGFFVVSNLALAQQTTEEIVVQAPIERESVEVFSNTGVKKSIVELNRAVSFADLDLSKESDVSELDVRIATVAAESCQKLSAMFPLDRSDQMEIYRCTKNAINSASKQKQGVIAALN